MTIEAANRLTFKVAIAEGHEDSPAGQIAAFEIVGNWNDPAVRENLVRKGLVVEAFINYQKELAIMVARRPGGETALYPLVETVQRDHICHTVTAPAQVPPSAADKATEIARKAIEAIQGVGVFGV